MMEGMGPCMSRVPLSQASAVSWAWFSAQAAFQTGLSPLDSEATFTLQPDKRNNPAPGWITPGTPSWGWGGTASGEASFETHPAASVQAASRCRAEPGRAVRKTGRGTGIPCRVGGIRCRAHRKSHASDYMEVRSCSEIVHSVTDQPEKARRASVASIWLWQLSKLLSDWVSRKSVRKCVAIHVLRMGVDGCMTLPSVFSLL